MGGHVRRPAFALLALVVAVGMAAQPVLAARPTPTKQATAVGIGGAAASVDPVATKAAIDVLTLDEVRELRRVTSRLNAGLIPETNLGPLARRTRANALRRSS